MEFTILTFGKILKWIGWVLIILAAIVITIGYISIWIMQGFSELQETLSPFNLWNVIAVMLTFAPGFIFKFLGKKIIENNS